MSGASCTSCGAATYVTPLHGDRGGPLMCPLCAGAWHAEHGRRRKWGRIVVKAIQAYMAAGGGWHDIDKLRLVASGLSLPGYDHGDTIGADVGDITTELLSDILQLTHPDRHPPDRRELAKRVTQDLLALKPFVFPKPHQPTVQPALQARDGSSRAADRALDEALRRLASYPCYDCANAIPYDYCAECRAEWEKRRRAEREKNNAKQRARYARRKRSHGQPPKICIGCDAELKSRRSDAKYCSAVCRQRAHRRRVTLNQSPKRGHLPSCDGNLSGMVAA